MVAPYAAGSSPAARTSAPAILIPVTNAIEALNAKLRRAVKIRADRRGGDEADVVAGT